MAEDEDIGAWPTVETRPATHHKIFDLQEVLRRSPRTGAVRPYQVLRMADWVNVVALTPDGQVVLIRQFRHGIAGVTLEIPGGLVDLGEAPEHAAARELLEETGYAGDVPRHLGDVHPNPAIQDNLCSTWLVTNARRVAEPDLDEGEHIAVTLAPLADIPRLVREQAITHALVVAAFHHLHLAGGPGDVIADPPRLR